LRERVAEEIARSEAVRADLDAALQRVDEIYALSRKAILAPRRSGPHAWGEIIKGGVVTQSGLLEQYAVTREDEDTMTDWAHMARYVLRTDEIITVKFLDDDQTYTALTRDGDHLNIRHEVRS